MNEKNTQSIEQNCVIPTIGARRCVKTSAVVNCGDVIAFTIT